MIDYYDRRADEYDAIYGRADPARQAEQAALAAALQHAVAGRRALEVACGSGYWTARAARAASQIVAVDAAPAMLARARARALSRVRYLRADAYRLPLVPGRFEAAYATFWLSHVPRARLGEFLDGLHARLLPVATVFLTDNVRVPDLGGELVAPAGEADTYKRRTLADGSEHLVLKNYHTAAELRALAGPDAQLHLGACFWWLSYVRR